MRITVEPVAQFNGEYIETSWRPGGDALSLHEASVFLDTGEPGVNGVEP
jgi:hypothetical protein